MPNSPKKADQYDDPTYSYLEYWNGRAYEHRAEVMAIKRLLSGKHYKTALDIGGGYGRLTAMLSDYADKITLAEPSQQQLDIAKTYLADHPYIERKLMQADKLDYPDASIDLITMIRVMHHLPDPLPELKEISRVLSLDGVAIIEVANYMHARNRVKHIVSRKPFPVSPVDIRTDKVADDIPFVNHNPYTVIKQLKQAGLKVERILSVSNLRSPSLKKIVPLSVMLAFEGILQPTLAKTFFGPSVFFLVKK
jgi:ubiquinone/menaquinone biosynthesis C-methylase UbiE